MADVDSKKLALILQAQAQRQKMLGDSLPQPFDANRPVQEPQQSWLDKLSEAASGFGYGRADNLEALGQMVRHPLDTLHSATVGISKAMDNPAAAGRAALEGIKQAAGEAVSSPFNMGRAVGANVTLNPRKLATMLDSPMVKEMTVYHGTPHQFPATETNPLGAFDASKIGTGEGAQAYGHGLYFAENPDVAGGYKKTIKQLNPWVIDGQSYHGTTTRNDAKIGDYAASALGRFNGDKKSAIDWLKTGSPFEREAANMLRKSKSIKQNVGSLYHVDLPDEMVDRMLDWDKPLSEQPKAVRQALLDAYRADWLGDESKQTGQDLYKRMGKMSGDDVQAVSRDLRDIGIPGIKYLDAGSRGAGGTGTRNFVVFPGEEDKLKILERK